MKRVLFTPEVRLYIKALMPTLYQLGYFGYLESSRKYVKELIDDIQIDLLKLPYKPAPQYFEKYGKNMSYAAFRKNKQTT